MRAYDKKVMIRKHTKMAKKWKKAQSSMADEDLKRFDEIWGFVSWLTTKCACSQAGEVEGAAEEVH